MYRSNLWKDGILFAKMPSFYCFDKVVVTRFLFCERSVCNAKKSEYDYLEDDSC
ncbi:MAG: hypothetical protein K0R34_3368 [Herbinix sp.]|jgi:hypothetical protein|nr:hypothetical protein [Herbinix sp.]